MQVRHCLFSRFSWYFIFLAVQFPVVMTTQTDKFKNFKNFMANISYFQSLIEFGGNSKKLANDYFQKWVQTFSKCFSTEIMLA